MEHPFFPAPVLSPASVVQSGWLVSNTLSVAEQWMEERPDSVQPLLEAIDTAALGSHGERARYALLLTQARHKNNVVETDDSLIHTAVRYYAGQPSQKAYLMKSLFYQGTILWHRSENNVAVIPAMRANGMAKELRDDYWIAKTAELLSFLFSEVYSHKDALKYEEETVIHYDRAGKIRNYRFALAALGIDYANNKDYSKAVTLLDSVGRMASEGVLVDSALLCYVLRAAVHANLYKKDYRQAQIEHLRLQSLGDYYRPDTEDYVNQAKLYMALGKRDSLEYLIDTASRLAVSLSDTAIVCRLKGDYLKAKGDFESSQLYTDSALICQGKIFEQVVQRSVIGAQRDYYNSRSEQARQDLSRMRRTVLISSLIFVVFCFLVIYFYRLRFRLKNAEIAEQVGEVLALSQKMKELLNSNRILSSTLAEKEENISRLTEKLHSRNAGLSHMSDAPWPDESHQVQVEHLLKEKWETINLLCSEFFEKGESEKTRASIMVEVERELKRICSSKHLKEIEKVTDRYMDGIVSKLRAQCSSFLQSDDILFITLIYAGFAPKTVCYSMEIKLKYFYNKRSRLIDRIVKSDAPDKELFVRKMK